MLNVGINGFGRIGRAIFRINKNKNVFNIVAINDINPDNNNMAYLLKYDSTYGRLDDDITAGKESIMINGKTKVFVYHKGNVDEVPWDRHDIDVVIDSSGIHENILRARKLREKGIKKCIITYSPDKELVDKTIIMGANEDKIDFENDFVISSSICDANAFAPVINLLNENFEVDHGFLTTLHPWLQYQNLLDGPSDSFAYPGDIYQHYVLGRASLPSLIPKPTSCITASCKVLDFLNDKFMSFSYRVPTAIVSSADISVKLNKKTNRDEIISLFKNEEKKQKIKIFLNNEEPLVSADFKGCEYSVVIDHRWTMVNKANYLKIVLWYDNEWGYSSRVIDLIKYLPGNL